MKSLCAALLRYVIGLVLLAPVVLRAETPIAVHFDPKSELSIADKAEKLWVFIPGQKNYPNGATFRKGFDNKEELIFFPPIGPTIGAARTLADGRWSSISPILIDDKTITNQFVFGITFVGALKESETMRLPFTVHDRKSVCFEVVGNRLGSKIDPVLRILDEKNHELSESDDFFLTGRDTRLYFTPPKPGAYTLEVHDLANTTSSENFFCLRSWEAVPEKGELKALFQGWVRDSGIDNIKVPRWVGSFSYVPDGQPRRERLPISRAETFESATARHVYQFEATEKQKLIIASKTREIGSPCDSRIRLFGETKNLISESVGAGFEGASLTNRFEKAGTYLLEVTEISRLYGPFFEYWLTIDDAAPGAVLTTESERVDFSKEGEAKLKIACVRYDYDGAVTLNVEGLPEGVTVVDGEIPAKKNEVELKLKADGKVEAFQVRIFGEIKQEGTEGTEQREFPVSTMPALKKLYPLMMFPTSAMDGWIAVNPAR